MNGFMENIFSVFDGDEGNCDLNFYFLMAEADSSTGKEGKGGRFEVGRAEKVRETLFVREKCEIETKRAPYGRSLFK